VEGEACGCEEECPAPAGEVRRFGLPVL
jgi:hypothetical protein